MTASLRMPEAIPTGELEVAEALGAARERTLALVAPLTDDQLEATFSALMSPLVWDLGHIAAFEDLWLVRRRGGRPLLRPELDDLYDAAETPRAARGHASLPSVTETLEYLQAVRARTREVIAERGVGDGVLHGLVLRHERQHTETMLQAIELAQSCRRRTGACRLAHRPGALVRGRGRAARPMIRDARGWAMSPSTRGGAAR